MPGDDLGAPREGDALANAEHHPKHEQGSEPAGECREQRAPRPQQNAQPEQSIDRKSVAQSSGKQLHGGIDPEEGREGDAVGFGREPEFPGHQRCSNADRAPIDVVQENRRAEEKYEQVCRAARGPRKRRRRHNFPLPIAAF